MKKHLKLWVTLLALTLTLVAGFTVSALAADEAPELDPTSPLYTPYGMIPEEYADVATYPFVAFDDNGNCLGAALKLVLDGSTDADNHIFKYVWKKEGNFYIYMRQDYTHTDPSYNLAYVNGNVVVDLGGHTLTYTNSLNPQMKMKGYNSRITFANGTLLAGANKVLLTQSITAASPARPQKMHFTFDNILFKLPNNYTPAAWVSSFDATKTNPDTDKGYFNDLTFRNCSFDMSNVSRQIVVAIVGHQTAQAAFEVTFSGVHLIGNPARFSFVKQQYTEDVTISYVPNEQGHILTNTRPTVNGVPQDGAFYDIPGGPVALCKAISTDETAGTTTYTLDTHERLTPYGWIPDTYADTTLYPILLFNDTTKTCVWGGNTWGGETSTKLNNVGGVLAQLLSSTYGLNKADGRGVIYFQGNQVDGVDYYNSSGNLIQRPAFYNFGGFKGQHKVDLNGFTLTAKDIVFFATNKDKSTNSYASLHVFNGTINLQSKALMNLGSNSYSAVYSKVFDFTFENVKIISTNNSNPLVSDGAVGANFITTYNLHFKNCEFTLADRSKPIFELGSTKTGTVTDSSTGEALTASSKDITVNVFFDGGSITSSAKRMPVIYTNAGNMENKTVTFLEGANGYTELRTLNTFTTALPEGYTFGGKTYILDGQDDTYSYYHVAIQSKYGLVGPNYAKYALIVFDQDLGCAVAAFDRWGGEGDNGGAAQYFRNNSAKNLVAHLQKNITVTAAYYNAGGIFGNKVLDLDGHTMTLTATFFHNQAKTKDAMDFVVKNGTINVGKSTVINIGAVISSTMDCEGRVGNFTFENVNFTNILKSGESKGRIVLDNLGGNKVTTTNIHFVNCNFETAGGYTDAMMYVGTTDTSSIYHNIHITVEGGSFQYDTTSIPHIYLDGLQQENKSIVFKANNGAYPTVTAVSGNTTTDVYPGENNAILGLRPTAKTETTITYTMTPFGFISAYLNLTNDINFVYRTFVPAKFTAPAVTFTVGDSTFTVDTYTVDENGYYLFRLPNINPARMGEVITAVLAVNNGEEQLTLTHNTLSVKSYAEAIKAQEEAKGEEMDTSLCELIDDLLVYGAAAQQYIGESADKFVCEIGTPGEIPAEENTLTFTGTVSDKGNITKFGMNLDGAFSFRLGIEANVAGLTLVAKCGEEEVVFNLDEYTAKDGLITIVYEGINANELDTDVTFTLMAGEEVVGKVLTVNANAYLVNIATGTDANLATLAKALYAYGVSAQAYAQN